ncbi:MAG: hypothetical protein V5A23_07870 [Halobacteriales archaeon]
MSAPGRREVAHRVFAAEYDAADFEYSESDEERAPNYVVTPTGARINRLFAVGVLTEVEQVGEEVLRARVVDPTGAFVVYAGQYQPDALAFLERADPPAFVSVTGKARTFSPDDSDVVYTSVRPESINEVDGETRDRWTVRTAEHTLARVATFDAALDSGSTGEDLHSALESAGAEPAVAAGIPVAMDHYGTTEQYLASLADVARDALRLVAGDVDGVEVPNVAPDATGDRTVDRDRIAAATDLAVATVEGGDPHDPEAATERKAAAATTTDGERSVGSTADEPEPAATTAESGAATATDEPEASTTSGQPESAGDAEAGTSSEAPGDFETTAGGTTEATAAEGGPGDFDAAAAESSPGDFDAGGGATDDSEAAERTAGDSDASGTTTDGADAGPEADDSAAETETVDAGESDGEVPEDVLDEEERERIESEYGTDFQTGTEVGDAGEAGIEPEADPIEPAEATETPAPTDESTDEAAGGDLGDLDAGGDDDSPAGLDDAEPAADESGPATGDSARESGGAASETDADAETESDAGEATDATDEPGDAPAEPDDVDLTGAVLERMAEFDDGDGADRERLIADVVDRHGVAQADVEDAIEDALMSGQCYEPADGKLSAI